MRIVVFSDSHNDFFSLKEVMRVQATAEAFIHLGDGRKEFEYICTNYPFKIMRCVTGNCDWGMPGEISDTLAVEGKKILFTHGHTFGVKSGLDKLKSYARGIKADIVLFGHTHDALELYEDGIYYMNPGSISNPRYGKPSYGTVDITNAGVVTSIVYL